MYVGITRAQRGLFVSHCLKRKRAQEWRVCEPSRFITEMGNDIAFSGHALDDKQSRAAGSTQLAQLKALLASREQETPP